MAEHLLLVGMMGAGKSTVGRLVAARLGWTHVDTDEDVERDTGLAVGTIFETSGEAAFRVSEAAALRRAVTGPEASVVSVGGGAVLDPGNREAMRGAGTVVWLRARHETLAARVGDGSGRPLLSADGGPVAGAIARLDARRRSLYAEVSDGVVDVDDLEPDEVAGRVLVAAGLTGGDR